MNTNKNEMDLIYLKGFLDSLSYINTFTNDGKNYYVELIDKYESNYQATLRNYFNIKNWEIETEIMPGDWRLNLQREIIPFFDHVIVETVKSSLKDEVPNTDNNAFNELIENKIQQIRQNVDFHIYY